MELYIYSDSLPISMILTNWVAPGFCFSIREVFTMPQFRNLENITPEIINLENVFCVQQSVNIHHLLTLVLRKIKESFEIFQNFLIILLGKKGRACEISKDAKLNNCPN